MLWKRYGECRAIAEHRLRPLAIDDDVAEHLGASVETVAAFQVLPEFGEQSWRAAVRSPCASATRAAVKMASTRRGPKMRTERG